jgi:hypothetical protein
MRYPMSARNGSSTSRAPSRRSIEVPMIPMTTSATGCRRRLRRTPRATPRPSPGAGFRAFSLRLESFGVLECFVFRGGEPSEQRRLLGNPQRPSKGAFKVNVREPRRPDFDQVDLTIEIRHRHANVAVQPVGLFDEHAASDGCGLIFRAASLTRSGRAPQIRRRSRTAHQTCRTRERA